MSDLQTVSELDLFTVGRTMSRERRQNGWIEKTGKRVKTWTGFWYAYVIENGVEVRRRRERVLGKCAEMTKGAATEKLYMVIRDDRPEASGATFEELSLWYLKTNSGRWSRKWKGTITGVFKHQILPHLGDRIASKIRRSDVQLAINRIATLPNSQSTSILQKCVTHIRAVFNMAIDDELLERNPALKINLPKVQKPSERFLLLSECQQLLSVAPVREHLILRLFIVLGLRPGELFALRVNDLGEGYLRVDQTVVDYKVKDQTKTEASRANVPLPSDVEAEIRKYINAEGITDLLFPSSRGTAISPDNYLDRVLKPLGELAGIHGLNHQVLRRTTATHFQKHGRVKDAQALLRHTNPSTTLKHYQQVLEESLVNGVESWDAELLKTPVEPIKKYDLRKTIKRPPGKRQKVS